jgi:hypothetical protein
MSAADDVTLQMMEHLRSLRLEVAALHEKIDVLAARLEDAIEGEDED